MALAPGHDPARAARILAEAGAEPRTQEQAEAMARILRRKASWHVSRAGSGGSWEAADRYTAEADRLAELGRRLP
jgi:hypothetical protein